MEEAWAQYSVGLRDFREGQVVPGSVVAVSGDAVLVDIGWKSEGVVSRSEWPDPQNIPVDEAVDVLIERMENEDGMVVLSKQKADRIKNWTRIQDIYENNGTIEGRVVKKVKGGLKVDIGLDAFLPASQVARRPTADLDQFIGKTVGFKIIKLTKRRRNVVLSRRQVLEDERSEQKAGLLDKLQIGMTLDGKVKNITDFGAFIDVGGIDGLLHITDMSWGRIKHPSELLKVGQELPVVVLSFDKDAEKISLGMKQLTENPWTTAAVKYAGGAVVTGKVVSMTDYGAFVELEEGVEGMVHISEMSWTKRVRHPSELVTIGEEVEVKVLNVDEQNQKISLGIKQVGTNPWDEVDAKYPIGKIATGTVRNLTDYGAFVELEEGIDGLLHVSDISWTKKVNHPSDLLTKGQEIEVKILSVDSANEKIALGMKQLESDPWQTVAGQFTVGEYIQTKISKLVSFGAFADLGQGVEGLVHISELSKDRVNKPEDTVSLGDEVMVKVISIDPTARKIGLSIKQYQIDDESKSIGEVRKAEASFTSGSMGEAFAAAELTFPDAEAESAGAKATKTSEAGSDAAEPEAGTEDPPAAEAATDDTTDAEATTDDTADAEATSDDTADAEASAEPEGTGD